MNGFFIRWLILGFSISAAAYLMEGIHVSGVLAAFAAAAMLGILNAVFRPIAPGTVVSRSWGDWGQGISFRGHDRSPLSLRFASPVSRPSTVDLQARLS